MSKVIETPLTKKQIAILRRVARLIAKGSKGREKVTGLYFGRPGMYEMNTTCCAIGACLIAVGAPESNSLVLGDWFKDFYDWPLINYPDGVPAWDRWNNAIYGDDRVKKPMPLVDVIMQLNDKAEWSFEKIVSYLREVAKKGIVTTITA